MRYVNTGFYYGPNTLSSVSDRAVIKTTGEEGKKRIETKLIQDKCHEGDLR